MASHWSSGDSKSPKVSRTLLVDLNNSVVWMVSTRPLIYKSFSPYTNPLVTVPSAPIIIGITVTFMFHSFFCSLARSSYLFSFRFLSLPCGQPKGQSQLFGRFSFLLLLLLTITWSGCLAEIRWSVCISKFQRGWCVLYYNHYHYLLLLLLL